MGSLRLVTILLLLGGVLGSPAFAQSPTYGVGRTPTAEEIRRMDISIGPTGEELPPGRGTAKEGAQVFEQKGCIACHGPAGLGGMAPELQSKKGHDVPIWKREHAYRRLRQMGPAIGHYQQALMLNPRHH